CQAPRGFPHQQGGVETLEAVPTRRDAAGSVGNGPALPAGAQGTIAWGFGNLNAHKTWDIPHGALLSARPGAYGLMAPDHWTGLGSPGRDDPRAAPVSVDQGSSGLSRPGTGGRGYSHITH